jgi:hypothetical protein
VAIHDAPLPRRRSVARSYSSVIRTTLVLCALLLAFLPIPVTRLGLLPAYRTHARFLVFYAPIVCLLLLAYLFYVRDAIARQIFANILNPLPEADPYYRTRAGESLERILRRLRTGFLALLPALLLLTSFYCIPLYTAHLRKSIELATRRWETTVPPVDRPDAVAARPTAKPPRRLTPGSAPRDSLRALPKAASQDSISASAPVGGPEAMLRTAGIESIPMFTELTALYIGIFAAAMTALTLMAIKEYGKEAMGLSDQDLMFGQRSAEEAGEPLE